MKPFLIEYNKIINWKESKRRKPLLIKGARQTGKTWLLKEFGKNNYEKTAYFNFEADPNLKELFNNKLQPKKIIETLSLYLKWDILPEKHLIIFDEIQTSDEALNSLKYFNEELNDYHIAAAGSLLGVKLSNAKSFPVGKVNFLDMYPMTFMEFLSACGETKLKKFILNTEKIQPYPLMIHNKLIELLRYYYFVGGMPEAVKYFSENKDFNEVREIQNEILTSYVLDFAKHARTSDIPKISLIWDSLPVHLSKENKKFIFSAVKKSARARDYENALQWLEDTGLIYRSYVINTIKKPLKRYSDRNIFKIFCLDVGLLGALSKLPKDILAYSDRLFKEYEGAFVENYVAQQLLSEKNYDLFYWTSSATAEVDFVIEHKNEIYPLEAKAGINPKSKSLIVYDKKYQPKTLYRTTLLNLVKHKKIINIPLYALSIFPMDVSV